MQTIANRICRIDFPFERTATAESSRLEERWKSISQVYVILWNSHEPIHVNKHITNLFFSTKSTKISIFDAKKKRRRILRGIRSHHISLSIDMISNGWRIVWRDSSDISSAKAESQKTTSRSFKIIYESECCATPHVESVTRSRLASTNVVSILLQRKVQSRSTRVLSLHSCYLDHARLTPV